MLQFEHFHNLNAKESQTHQEDEFNDIFVEDKGDGRPVDIDHHMHFSDHAWTPLSPRFLMPIPPLSYPEMPIQ